MPYSIRRSISISISISLSVVAIWLLISLTGCMGSRVAPHSDAGINSPEAVNITYAQWSVPSKNLDAAINQFNEQHQGRVHIDVVNIPLDRYMQTLNMMNASDNGPDVYEVLREWLNSYIIKGWVAELPEATYDELKGAMPDWARNMAMDDVDGNGKLYSLPSNQITYRLIYNRNLFKETGLDPNNPPKTLAEFEQAAERISKAEVGNRKYGFAMPLGEPWMDFVQPMEALNAYSGRYFFNFKADKYDLTVYQPWLDMLNRLQEDGALFPGMDTMKSSQAIAQFADGNVGMMVVPSWEIALLFSEFSPHFNWGVTMPPAIDGAHIGAGAIKIDFAGWNVVNAHSRHPAEAEEVRRFLYSRQFEGQLFHSGSMVPLNTSILQDPLHQPVIPNFKPFLPGKFDSAYPDTPLPMEEWARKNVYLDALSDTQGNQQPLLEESNRLNTLLTMAITAKTITYKKYNNLNFDPRHPFRKNQ